MDVSGLLVAVAAAAALAAALIGRRAYLRWVRAVGAPKDERLDRKAAGAATGPSATGSRSRKWNVELQVPSRKRACREALTLSGRHFPNGAVPPVPLPHCSVPHRCRCSFVKVTDRRSHTQRSGQERRWGERDETEKIDRRVAEDRRADATLRLASRTAATAALADRVTADRIVDGAAQARAPESPDDVAGRVKIQSAPTPMRVLALEGEGYREEQTR